MMRSLLAFGSGGGSGFPGSPVAGFYLADDATLDAVCAAVVSTIFSVVVNTDKNTTWYSDGTQMILLSTTTDFVLFPLPTTSGGVVYSVPTNSVGFDEDSDKACYFDGTDWINTGQP